MLFTNVLVAYDGSDQSEKALKKAIEIAKQSPRVKLNVVHVFELPQYVIGESLITAPVYLETEHYSESERLVEKAAAKIAHLENAEATMLQGYASKTILDHVEKTQSDLIVIGSRGLGGFKELILGSVSNNVVQHAKVPVLVIK